VRKRIPDSPEASFQQRGEAFMFCLLCISPQRVDRENRALDLNDSIDERSAVRRDSGQVADSLGQSLAGFKNGVKVVVLEKLGSAVLQHLGVHAPTLELSPNGSDTPLGLIKCLCSLALPELSILTVFETGKGQDRIEFLSMRFELRVPPNEAGRNQEGLNEVEYTICTLMLLLGFEEYPIETTPLCRLAGCVHQTAVAQHTGNVRAGPTFAEQARQCLDLPLRQ
jgi:hypothetical protein